MKNISLHSFKLLTILLGLILISSLRAQTSFNISNKTTGDTLLTIDNDGNVGIGITNPVLNLEIIGNNPDDGGLLRLGNSDLTHQLLFFGGRENDPNPFIHWTAGDPLRFSTNESGWTELMRLSSDGNLGIGTTNPSAKFTISGISGSLNHGESAVFLQNSNRYFDFNGGMIFRGSGMNWNSRFTATDNLGADGEVVGIYKHEATAGDVLNDVSEVIATFKNNGNVGIGFTNPDQGLVVADTIRSTLGGFQFPDGTVQETAAGGGISGNTLDQAYDQGGAGAGQDITADNGSVRILGNDGLYVQGDINTSSSIHGGGSMFLYGSGNEGGQLSLRDGDDDGDWIMDNYGGVDNEALRFFRGSALNALVISSTGNVGIGTGGPSEKLTVAGTVHSTTGGFRFPDGTLQTSAATGGSGVSSIDNLTDGKTGGNSVFLGSGAGESDDGSENQNTAVGINALNSNTYGNYNTATGHWALYSNISGGYNTAYGNNALISNTGNSNTANGYWALNANTTGSNNVGIGRQANYWNQEGSNNTIIGVFAGRGTAAHNKSGNVFLGYEAGYSESGDNKLYIENSSSTTPLIGGDFASNEIYLNGRVGIGTASPAAGLHLYGTGYPSSFMHLQSETGGSAGFRLYEGSTAKWHIFNSYTLDGLHIYNDNGQTVFYADQTTSNVGIRTTNPTSTLTVAGTIECDVLEINGGSDIAEPFDINHTEGIEAGMVMAIDSENPGKIKISGKAYDRCVAGIISGAGGINPGMIMGQSGTIADGEFPVALTGRVYCKADASNGSINPGDLLTTSDIPGHAMKVIDYTKAQGAVLGKAMSSLDEGQGLILVLVSLQ